MGETPRTGARHGPSGARLWCRRRRPPPDRCHGSREITPTLRIETPLADDRVLLRPPAPADVPAIAAACADPGLARWLPRLPQPYGVADAEAFVAHVARAAEAGTEVALAVTEPPGTEVVGMLGLEPVQRRTGLEVGYWLAPAARGRGLATRAVRLACAWAFAAGWPRVEALVRPDNAPSLAVLQRAGFRREGLLRRTLEDRGVLRDVVILARLPDDPAPG